MALRSVVAAARGSTWHRINNYLGFLDSDQRRSAVTPQSLSVIIHVSPDPVRATFSARLTFHYPRPRLDVPVRLRVHSMLQI